MGDPFTISYDVHVGDISNILLSPTRLESTSLVLLYGSSLFFNKVMPDNSFDKLGDDFNYVFLIFTVLLVIIATKVAKTFVNRTKINQHF